MEREREGGMMGVSAVLTEFCCGQPKVRVQLESDFSRAV